MITFTLVSIGLTWNLISRTCHNSDIRKKQIDNDLRNTFIQLYQTEKGKELMSKYLK